MEDIDQFLLPQLKRKTKLKKMSRKLIVTEEKRTWYLGRYIHRDILPAVIFKNGDKQWWFDGCKHRDNDLPAIDYKSGLKIWMFMGRVHREDGPSVIYPNGDREWHDFGKLIKWEKAKNE